MTTTYRRTAAIQQTSDGRPIRAVLTTADRAADGLALVMSGARLDRYRANPVILWGHSHSELPIGRVVDLRVHNSHMDAELQFSRANPKGEMVEALIREGTLSGISIGFDPQEIDRDGTVSVWELLEVSAVPVPMDASALVTSRAVGTDPTARALLDAFGPFPAGARTVLDAFDRR